MSAIRYSKIIAFSSIFGALAFLISISGLSTVFFYPPAPFLKFDVSEIIDLLALFIGGYVIGVMTSLIHMIGLFFMGANVPLGPSLKFLAVVSMFPGFYIGELLGRKYNLSKFYSWLISLFTATISRLIVMSIANIIVLTVIAPEFLTFFMVTNSGSNPVLQALITALIVIGSYNVIHAIFTILLATGIYDVVKRHIKIA
jgi:riboflavin transporter FmnP